MVQKAESNCIIIQNHQEVYGSIRRWANVNLAESESLKSKIKIKWITPADGNTKYVKITVLQKYLSNFLRTFEMPLINCEINLDE